MMFKVVHFIVGVICVCLISSTFLPLSSGKYLKMKKITVNLGGEKVIMESVISSVHQKTRMTGLIYVHYNSKSLSAKNCQLKANLTFYNDANSTSISHCRSGDKNCDAVYEKKHTDKRMFLDIEKELISPINVSLSLENKASNLNDATCPAVVEEIRMIPKWHRINIWQRALSR